MSATSTRPRDVALASVLTIVASVLALAGIFGAQGQLRSSSVRREIEDLLTDQRFATVDLSVDTLLNVIEYGLMVAAAASVAAIVLAVFVMRRHNPSRIALTTLGGLLAVLMLLSGLTGLVSALFVGYTVSLLWRAPVRTWFATASAGEGTGAGPRGSGTYWGMSSPAPGGGSAGSGSEDAGPGAESGPGAGGEPEPSRNPDAVPDPDPHWPSDPAQPDSGPGPYPRPWPADPGHQPGQHGGPGPHRPAGDEEHPTQSQPGAYGPTGEPEPPGEPGEQAGEEPGGQSGRQPGGGWDPGYPGPHPSERRAGYGYPPAYPSGGHGGGQGDRGDVRGYPGRGYPYASSYYGYPPPSGDPYRRPGQVVAAHVLTWVGAAFGLVTGVFFVVAATSPGVLTLVEEQLAAGGVSRSDFSAMLIAAGIITALWSVAVVAVSVFSWRGHNWAAILLTVMGGGYLLVQLFTLLTGQLPVLFTIVWVAAVLTLLWWPVSRQWYAARRTGQQGPGPQGPYGPYGGPSGPGSPYPPSPPPHRNQPW